MSNSSFDKMFRRRIVGGDTPSITTGDTGGTTPSATSSTTPSITPSATHVATTSITPSATTGVDGVMDFFLLLIAQNDQADKTSLHSTRWRNSVWDKLQRVPHGLRGKFINHVVMLALDELEAAGMLPPEKPAD